jgi:hypothetical protein
MRSARDALAQASLTTAPIGRPDSKGFTSATAPIGPDGRPLEAPGYTFHVPTGTWRWAFRGYVPNPGGGGSTGWVISGMLAQWRLCPADIARLDAIRARTLPPARKRKKSTTAELKAAKRAGATAATLPSGMQVSFAQPTPAVGIGAGDEVETWFKKHAH